MSDEAFLRRPKGRWSPADHWRHLVKSVRPLARALRLPRFALRLLFGRARKPSRSYTEIRRTYRAALDAGGQAGRFAPAPVEISLDQAKAHRQSIARDWEKTSAALRTGLAAWNEPDLDRLRLPHPFLGKLTVREMILFTLYHNLHHVENVRNRLDSAHRDEAKDDEQNAGT